MIAGRHRFEAARNCGHQTIRAEVYDSLSDDEAELIQIDENLIKANLSDAERILARRSPEGTLREATSRNEARRRPEIRRGQIKRSRP